MIGLIGEKLSHSKSKEIHERFLCPEYRIVEVKKDEIPDFLKNDEYIGFNVTIPYKQIIMPFLDSISEEAQLIGAVNTVYKKDGKLYGYNTDAGGMMCALENAHIDCKNKNVLILGTGGTSKTATFVANKLGAKTVSIVGRTSDINYENVYSKCAETEVIINTTPVGMYPNINAKPIEIKQFKKLEGVFDCIYNPFQTQLVKEAIELNINTSNGLRMLVDQARLAEEIFYNTKIPKSKTEEVLKDIEKILSNN